jgi:hypothetical protein
MKRRALWFAGLIALIAVVIGGWFLFGKRDADYYTIGPITTSTHVNLVLLDSTIDASDFRDCQNLQEALNLLQKTLEKRGEFATWGVDVAGLAFRSDVLAAPVQYPAESTPMTAKEFLRMTFRQVSNEKVGFVVGPYSIQADTIDRIEEGRARYEQGLSLADRVKLAWNSLMGHVEDDPPMKIKK